MGKHYFCVVSGYGFISLASKYGQPKLHAFITKKERDEFMLNEDLKNGDINYRAWDITAVMARKYYSRIVDGTRYYNCVTHDCGHIDDWLRGSRYDTTL